MTRERNLISFTGNEAIDKGWLYPTKMKTIYIYFELKSDIDTTFAVRKAIADKQRVDVSQIGEDLCTCLRGDEQFIEMSDKFYRFSHYRVIYTYKKKRPKYPH